MSSINLVHELKKGSAEKKDEQHFSFNLWGMLAYTLVFQWLPMDGLCFGVTNLLLIIEDLVLQWMVAM